MAEESVASLVSGIINDARELFREEIALAKAEVRIELANARAAAIKIGLGAGALAIGALFLLAALARGFADLVNVPIWGGFLAVGVGLAIVGLVFLLAARSNMRRVGPVPERTMRTMKENAEWLKRQSS